ncbi:hypothetical protein MKEN_00593600 [Mycena kentingensis (nom. inval.)]|nr:hypothetical protein MKEN_00593600 [Mycena kentingensis (nom. inval.)]
MAATSTPAAATWSLKIHPRSPLIKYDGDDNEWAFEKHSENGKDAHHSASCSSGGECSATLEYGRNRNLSGIKACVGGDNVYNTQFLPGGIQTSSPFFSSAPSDSSCHGTLATIPQNFTEPFENLTVRGHNLRLYFFLLEATSDSPEDGVLSHADSPALTPPRRRLNSRIQPRGGRLAGRDNKHDDDCSMNIPAGQNATFTFKGDRVALKGKSNNGVGGFRIFLDEELQQHFGSTRIIPDPDNDDNNSQHVVFFNSQLNATAAGPTGQHTLTVSRVFDDGTDSCVQVQVNKQLNLPNVFQGNPGSTQPQSASVPPPLETPLSSSPTAASSQSSGLGHKSMPKPEKLALLIVPTLLAVGLLLAIAYIVYLRRRARARAHAANVLQPPAHLPEQWQWAAPTLVSESSLKPHYDRASSTHSRFYEPQDWMDPTGSGPIAVAVPGRTDANRDRESLPQYVDSYGYHGYGIGDAKRGLQLDSVNEKGGYRYDADRASIVSGSDSEYSRTSPIARGGNAM